MRPFPRRAIPLLTAVTWAAGNLTPILMIWLLWPRAGMLRSPGQPGLQPLAIDFALALLFPLQHSVWTQTPVKAALRRYFSDYFERPAYVIASGLALSIMCLGWQSSSAILWTAPTAWIWAARILFIGALAWQVYCSSLVGTKFLTGLTQLKDYAEARPVRTPVFKEQGPYRRMRHPIATSQVVMVWCIGSLTADRLLLSVIWTIWIVAATALEDRRLAVEFGSAYQEYRRRAGFLWPRIH